MVTKLKIFLVCFHSDLHKYCTYTCTINDECWHTTPDLQRNPVIPADLHVQESQQNVSQGSWCIENLILDQNWLRMASFKVKHSTGVPSVCQVECKLRPPSCNKINKAAVCMTISIVVHNIMRYNVYHFKGRYNMYLA